MDRYRFIKKIKDKKLNVEKYEAVLKLVKKILG